MEEKRIIYEIFKKVAFSHIHSVINFFSLSYQITRVQVYTTSV